MRKKIFPNHRAVFAVAAGILASFCLNAQNLGDLTPQMPVSDPHCPYFGNQSQGTWTQSATQGDSTAGFRPSISARRLSELTSKVSPQLAGVPGGGRTGTAIDLSKASLIDGYIFGALQSAGVQPADPSTDWEFIRRVTLDLTGKIPVPADVLSFVADTNPSKRAALVDKLIASTSWVDKWTMYFGDLYKNNASNAQINRYRPGVQAFYNYLKASLASNKSYDQLTRELITAQGETSYTQGEIAFTVGGVVTGGPTQDLWDQQLADVSETFLGIAHQNCILCHNGAGHLDTLSVWGAKQTRFSAWQMAAFFAHTYTYSTPVAPPSVTPRYWTVSDGTRYTSNYSLNTTTGNRPPRTSIGTISSVAPVYSFTGESPKAGENYRAALARMLTADPQFARATVNYMWAYFFGVGLVDPPDQFDPLRLDPDNPPPASSGFSLQPSNPRLLNALAQAFAANKFDLQWLMRQIVNSQAYQLSSRYDGTWNQANDNLFGRKLVRRLWGEEIHDAIAMSSGQIPSYNLTTYGTVSYAMQFPEPFGIPDGGSGNISGFLDAFLRGNRDDQPRNGAGSILQALNLMNDSYIVNRLSTTAQGGILAANLSQSNTQLVNNLFLAVLSRYPSQQEMGIAMANLSNSATRTVEAQNLLWSLYNKVDFIFNY